MHIYDDGSPGGVLVGGLRSDVELLEAEATRDEPVVVFTVIGDATGARA